MLRGDMVERFHEHATHPDFTACTVSASMTFRGIGTREEFEQHRALDARREVEEARLTRAVLERRKKSEVAAMQMIGLLMLHEDERAEIAAGLAAFNRTLDDPVQNCLTNITHEAEAGLRPIIEDALGEGMAVEHGMGGVFKGCLSVEARAPLFASLDDFGAALERRYGRFGWLKQAAKRLLGIQPPPAPRPEPHILLEFHEQFHGPRPLIEAAVARVEAVLKSLGSVRSFKADYHRSMYAATVMEDGRIVERGERLAAREREREERAARPMPEPGRRLFAILTDLGDALKAADPAAFTHAQRFVELVRADADVLRMFRQPSGRVSRGNPNFEAASDRKLRKAIETRVAGLIRDRDLEGVCDYFFEMRHDAQGVFRELHERSVDVAYPRNGHELYDTAFARVFGTPECFDRHFGGFMKDGHEPTPKRVRELNAQRTAELDEWSARIDRLRAEEAAAEARRAQPPDQPGPAPGR